MKELPRFYSIPTAAAMTGLSESLLRQWVNDGQLRALRASSKGRIKLTLEDVDQLLSDLSSKAPTRSASAALAEVGVL